MSFVMKYLCSNISKICQQFDIENLFCRLVDILFSHLLNSNEITLDKLQLIKYVFLLCR